MDANQPNFTYWTKKFEKAFVDGWASIISIEQMPSVQQKEEK